MLINQQFLSVANKNLARPAFRYLGKETSYADLRSQISRLSYLYQNELGLAPRVAFFTRNAPAVITSIFAIANIRGVSIPLDPDATPEALVAWLKESKATHLAVTSDLTSRARDLLNDARLSLPVVEIEKKHGGEYDTSFTTSPDNQPSDKDLILLLRTAGITDKPKLCAFSHLQINHAATCLRSPYHINVNDRYYTQMNWSHPFAFVHGLLFPLLNGATIVIDHGLDGAEFLSFLTESRVNRILGTPSLLFKLLINCSNEKRALVGIKSITVGAGQLAENAAAVFQRMKIPVAHCYGQTEALWTLSMQDTAPATPPEEDEFPGSHRPLAGMKYKVLDANGDQIEGEEPRSGLLAVNTPTLMTKYDGLSKELDKVTKNVIRGTWLYTGDMAQLVGDGENLKLIPLGRKADLFEFEGEIIAMPEITAVLKSIAGVDDAAAFVAQTSRNERVIAGAVVKAQTSSLNDKAIVAYCKQKLYEGRIPYAIVFTDSIPKDLAGNPNYSKLRSQFSGAI